jgi:hypothetical protein
VFRAADGVTTVVRDIVITNASTAADAEVALRVRPLTRAGEWWLYYAKSFPVGSVHVDSRQVVEPGEALELFSTAGGLFCAVTGYILGA